MSTFLWACFDGGGNIPPSVGIAAALTGAGHQVCFAGRPEMVPRIEAAGLRAVELAESYRHADRFEWHPRGQLFAYLTDPAVGEELLALAKAEEPDVVVLDAMFGAALEVAPRFGRPTAVMLHTFLHRTLPGWEVMMQGQSEARERAGFDPLPPLASLWGDPDLFHVNTLGRLDSAPRVTWPHIRHGAPVLTEDSRSLPPTLPWAPDDPTPLVVISFSTAIAQGSRGKLQRTFDALAGLPVHAVATTGGAVDPSLLRLPDNAYAVPFAGHEQLMARAALVVTHGGHGTAMRALRRGLPLVCLAGQAEDQPGVAALDQPCVAAFIEEYRVGVALDADAPAADIRAAVERTFDEPAIRRNAGRLAQPLRDYDGAAIAAERLAALASGARIPHL